MANRRSQITLAIAGIVIELVAIGLLVAKMISLVIAIPLIIAGMFLAFVPMFAVARSRRP